MFSKIFNRINIKVSCSCMYAKHEIKNQHNKTVINPKPSSRGKTWNCINKSNYTLNNTCLSNNVLYKSNITPRIENYENKIYYSSSETKFKSRYPDHWKTFENRKHKAETELFNEIWKLKEQNKNVDKILWQILGIDQSHNITKRCNLCLNKKLATVIQKQDNILNKRNCKQTIFKRNYFKQTEIISKCSHSNKYTLANYDTKD